MPTTLFTLNAPVQEDIENEIQVKTSLNEKFDSFIHFLAKSEMWINTTLMFVHEVCSWSLEAISLH